VNFFGMIRSDAGCLLYYLRLIVAHSPLQQVATDCFPIAYRFKGDWCRKFTPNFTLFDHL